MRKNTRKLLAGIFSAAALTIAMGMTAFAGDNEYLTPYDPMFKNLEKTLEESNKQYKSAYDSIIADFEKEVEKSREESQKESKKNESGNGGAGSTAKAAGNGTAHTARVIVPKPAKKSASKSCQ